MPRHYPAITYTGSVKETQQDYGTRENGARLEAQEHDDKTIGWREADFITQRDSFYMASVGETGWPYVQFRGGPQGFLKVIDEKTLGYADFRGNLQYISVGNFRSNNRVALILMDYANRRRLKIMARTEVYRVGERADLDAAFQDPEYPAKVERAVLFHVEALDWNCPKFITPRYTEEQWAKRNKKS
jgi:hypothetical protein